MVLHGKQVGSAPRPRVALVGADEDEYDQLRDFFPTVYQVERLIDLPKFASPAELDLIVSVGTESMGLLQLHRTMFDEILEYIFAEFDLPVHNGKRLYMLQDRFSSRPAQHEVPPTRIHRPLHRA